MPSSQRNASSSSSIQLAYLPSASSELGPTPGDGDSPAAHLVDQAAVQSSAADDTASAIDHHFALFFNTPVSSRKKNHLAVTVQGRVYNFLERPTGWKCFLYHFTV